MIYMDVSLYPLWSNCPFEKHVMSWQDCRKFCPLLRGTIVSSALHKKCCA